MLFIILIAMDVVELTKELINIPSESERDGEREVAKYIADYLKGIGIEPELIQFGSKNANVIASIGEGDGLMLNGHMDTVPLGDPGLWTVGTSAVVKDSKVYGRGASDMKGGLACIIKALENLAIAKKQLKRRLLVTFVAGEEVDFSGSLYLLDNRKELFDKVKYGVIGEASFINSDISMQIAQKGAMSIEVTFRGKAAHASRPWLGDNAILKAAKFITEYQKLADNLKIEDKLLGKGSVNIGIIKGGTATNVVPDTCKVSIDRRLVPGETPKMAIEEVETVLSRLGISTEITTPVSREAFKLSDTSEIISIVKEAIGQNIKTIGATGYTEAELYKAKANIDSVVFGPGEKDIIHQANEYVPIENLNRTEKAYEGIIKRWCQ